LAGDDTHLIVENLRRHLYTVEETHDVATEPLFMGALTYKAAPYNDGGAGYVLNRVALKRLVLEAFPKCHAKKKSSLALDWLCLHLSTQDLPPLFTEGHMRDFHNNQNNHAATTATPLVLVAPTSTSTSTSEAISTLQQQRQEDLATTPSFYQSKETAVPIEEDEQEKAAHRALVAMCSCACA
jgi:hypothetical protein